MCLVGVVVRRYIHITYPTPLVSALFLQQHHYFLFIFNVLVPVLFCKKNLCIIKYFSRGINTFTGNYLRPTAAI